jgi:hypothetical protein
MPALSIAAFKTPQPDGRFCIEVFIPDAQAEKLIRALEEVGPKVEMNQGVRVIKVQTIDENEHFHDVSDATGFTRIVFNGDQRAFFRGWLAFHMKRE